MSQASAGRAHDLPGLDLTLVREWIEQLGLGVTAPYRAAPLGDGKSNLTFRIEDGSGRQWVLRRPPLGTLLPSAHDLGREYRILQRLWPTPVPVPRPVALRAADDRLGVPLLLMEFVPGCVVDSDAVLATIDHDARHALGLSLAATLAKIHAIDLVAAGLDDLARPRPYAERQLDRWLAQFEASTVRDLPVVTELCERLRATIPPQHEVVLVHGDFHLGNAIAEVGGGSVTAVVDWELATLGDPVADLGGLLAYWPEADDQLPAAPTRFPAQPGFPSRRELVDAYVQASGRSADAIGFWETLCCWKVAIISDGVLRRSIDHPGRRGLGDAASITDTMLLRAVAAAERAGI